MANLVPATEPPQALTAPAPAPQASEKPCTTSTTPISAPSTTPTITTPSSPTRSRRVRRAPEKFIPSSQSKPKEKASDLSKGGDGVALGKVPNIAFLLSKTASKSEEIILLHRLLYNSTGVATKRKADIREFCGWGIGTADDENSTRKINELRVKDKLRKVYVSALKKVAGLLDLPTSGNKDDLIKTIVGFLKRPSVIEGRVDLVKREEKKKEIRRKKRERSRKKMRGGVVKKIRRIMKKTKSTKGEDMEVDDKEEDESGRYSDADVGVDEDFAAGESKNDNNRGVPRKRRLKRLGLGEDEDEADDEAKPNDSVDQGRREAPSTGDTGEESIQTRKESEKLTSERTDPQVTSGKRQSTVTTLDATAKRRDEAQAKKRIGVQRSAQNGDSAALKDKLDNDEDTNNITNEFLVQKTTALVNRGNLEELTLRKVRYSLEETLGCKFTKEQRALIKKTVTDTVANLPRT